jgi:hypothetical protein
MTTRKKKKPLKCCEDIGDSWKAVKTLDRSALKRVEEGA